MLDADAFPDDRDPEREAQERQERLLAGVKSIIAELDREAQKRVSQRQPIEERWLEDLEQYHGEYSASAKNHFAEQKANRVEGSMVFANMTRVKTNQMSAKLWDLLFPTDDRNWDIARTPVPELDASAQKAADRAAAAKVEAKAAQKAADEAEGDPAMVAEAQAITEQANTLSAEMDKTAAVIDEATRRAEAMRAEIEDQLGECRWSSEARDVIESGVQIGAGIVEGPATGGRGRARWVMGPDGFSPKHSGKPEARSVDPWSFFPDLESARLEDGEGVFIRHMMNPKQVRRLASRPGFDSEAVIRLLKAKATKGEPSYMPRLRAIRSEISTVVTNKFHVWQYTGPLDMEQMKLLAEASGDDKMIQVLEEKGELFEAQAVVWFCQGEVLKFALHPLDSGAVMYSIYALEKDPASPFGFGMPRIMRDEQAMLSACWRMMMDNGALGTGSQVVVDKEAIEPADGRWAITPRKVWYLKSQMAKGMNPFQSFSIDMNLEELGAMLGFILRLIDEVSGLPTVMNADQGASPVKTAAGTVLLMNSQSVPLKRFVKNFDDDVTEPLIIRFYDWNMQFSEKQSIKGDYNIIARGSSALLMREMEAQNLLGIAMTLGAHPIYGPMLKHAPLLRRVLRAHMLPESEIALTDAEISEATAAAPDDPQTEAKRIEAEYRNRELEVRVQVSNMEADSRLKVAQMNYNSALAQAAARLNMTVEQAEAKLGVEKVKVASSERKLAAEIADKRKTGVGGGGSV